MHQNAPTIYRQIQNANNILVVSHYDPDGDALGSALAISLFLDKFQKNHTVFNKTVPAKYFDYLPRIEQIITPRPGSGQAEIPLNLELFDLIIALDCGDIDRTGIVELLNAHDHYQLVNIDHHISNNNYGHHNLVMPQSSSTSEIIYNFLQYHSQEIDKDIATCLLTGIITDTMNFTNSGTTNDSLKIASELLKKGARITQVTDAIIRNKKINALKLWGQIFDRLQLNERYGIGYTVIRQQDFSDFDIEEDSLDGMANFLNSLNNVKAILILQEKDNNVIKGSFRTTRDDVDVSKLAAMFGGGGHRKAAGFRINGRLVETATGWQIQ